MSAKNPIVPDPDDFFSRLLSVVSKKDQRIITVLLVVIGLGVGTFSTWAYASSVNDEHINSLVEAKTASKLEDHSKRLESLEGDREKTREDVADIKADVRVIRQMITDRLPEKR